tara:strand:- start:326 stop:592 length:267 start_codon:yes stop_codon:yes gene_type:complete
MTFYFINKNTYKNLNFINDGESISISDNNITYITDFKPYEVYIDYDLSNLFKIPSQLYNQRFINDSLILISLDHNEENPLKYKWTLFN